MDPKSKQRGWLEANNEAIRWRLVGPNFKNRFDSATSDSKLEEFLQDRSQLMEICEVQAMMDDATIIKAKDLYNLQVSTEHPNVIGIESREFQNYLEDSGIWKQMMEEFEGLLGECKAELDDRRGGGGF